MNKMNKKSAHRSRLVESAQPEIPRPSNAARGFLTKLKRTDTGKIIPSFDNATYAFRHAPEWSTLAFNDFKGEMVNDTPPVTWNDTLTLFALEWLHDVGVRVSKTECFDALTLVARKRTFHPVRDYLNELVWDGVGRIDNLFFDYFGTKPLGGDRDRYVQAVASKWMISAVARAYRPGCKADHLLILVGPQGMGKSTGIAVLVGPNWFSDNLADIHEKDAMVNLQGNWVIELAELKQLLRLDEAEYAKAFFSRQTDKFRPPYGRVTEEHPRQCVFFGTTNRAEFLRDDTGNRRYWPIECGQVFEGRDWQPGDLVDVEALSKARNLLWAEAVARSKAGETWHLDDKTLISAASAQRREHFESDVWTEKILTYAEYQIGQGDASVSISDILERALGRPTGQWHPGDTQRVGRILRHHGWQFKKTNKGNVWLPPV